MKNYKTEIKKEITTALNNLQNLSVSNRIKAEVLFAAIEPLIAAMEDDAYDAAQGLEQGEA